MKTADKIQIILKRSEKTQVQLANELGVSFPTLNSWLHEKSIPRKSAQIKIDDLYLLYSGEKQIPEGLLSRKKELLQNKASTVNKILSLFYSYQKIREQIILSLTFNSNKIEGSSLSEAETAAVLFHNTSIPNKKIIELIEAKNHETALNFLFLHLTEHGIINQQFILKTHFVLMNSIIPDAGHYRKHGVRIVGSAVPTANYLKISNLMLELESEINKPANDIIRHVSAIHSKFEQIHPFSDGNGRVGRILINAMLLKAGYAPAIIDAEKRSLYITYLQKAQLRGDLSLFEDFLCDAIDVGFKMLET